MFHVISISIFWLYQVPLYLILLYQFPDIGYIRFRYIKVCHISFHFCHIRFCYIKFQFGYIRFVISDSVISKSVISKGPSPSHCQSKDLICLISLNCRPRPVPSSGWRGLAPGSKASPWISSPGRRLTNSWTANESWLNPLASLH